jgi:hypothetical protein
LDEALERGPRHWEPIHEEGRRRARCRPALWLGLWLQTGAHRIVIGYPEARKAAEILEKSWRAREDSNP